MMLSPAIYLLLHGLFFTLRLSGGGGSFPRPLKAEEEREYLRRWAQGDLEARNKLVEHNLRLVAHIVKKYYSQSGDQEDLISIGTIGLIKGISTFKSDKNLCQPVYRKCYPIVADYAGIAVRILVPHRMKFRCWNFQQ